MENFRNHRLLWKSLVEALSGQRSRVCGPPLRGWGHHEAERPSRGNLAANTRWWLAYSPMSRSCAGGMRGGEGKRTSAPVTV